ncbi:MAG: 50S ribosomal protein L20 [Candidatus Uhrbacteria bacterium]
MPRVKRGTIHATKRRNLLKRTKGYKWGRNSKLRFARVAALKAGAYAFRDRRNKKRVMRRLWTIKINAGARPLGITYSQLINGLNKNKIEIDRKILADLAEHNPEAFKAIVEKVK